MDLPLTVYWPALAGALFLLFFPPSIWLRPKEKRYLSRPDGAGEFRLKRGATVWQNWVDLVRGFAGCYLLIHYALEAPEEQAWTLFGWQLGILLTALLIQTVHKYRRKRYFLAPVTYIWGMTFVLVGPLTALYGIIASVIVSNVAENLEWKLPVMAAVVGVSGYLLLGLTHSLIIAVIAIIFPLIATLCGGGRLAFLMPEEKRK